MSESTDKKVTMNVTELEKMVLKKVIGLASLDKEMVLLRSKAADIQKLDIHRINNSHGGPVETNLPTIEYMELYYKNLAALFDNQVDELVANGRVLEDSYKQKPAPAA